MPAALALIAWLLAMPAAAQEGTAVPFGRSAADAAAPVEITAERLELDRAAGTAVFTGSVRAGQGALRIAADRMEVRYAGEVGAGEVGAGSGGTIERIEAEGSVTLSNGSEAAESARATYDVGSGVVEMEGDVLLTQGESALSSDRMRIDLRSGVGLLEGRVRTIFVPAATAAGARP